jgi:hypothetical protein
MATFHIDLVNGNDANTGVDWANAWLTVNSGATAARIAPGDLIKISKTGDPVSLAQTAQWTNLSQTVTLTTAVNKHINQAVGNTWTASTSVTAGSSTLRKFGATAQSLAIAAGFTTGKIAYAAVDGGGTQDFSGYQKISFWIRPTIAVAASTLSIRLCSDATGDTTVDTLAIPAMPAANAYYCIEIDKGSALGASIQSVALYADLDPGAVTILLNNIVAGNTITHRTLIGKDDGFWWAIQSIDNATLKIDEGGNNTDSGRGYYGVTESVTTYYRIPLVSGSLTMQDSGTTNGGYIEFSGGWDTSSNVKNGDTYLDGISSDGAGNGFNLTSFTKLNNVSLVRFTTGIAGNVVYGWELSDVNTICCGRGFNLSGLLIKSNIINSKILCNGNGHFLPLSSVVSAFSLINCKIYSNGGRGFVAGNASTFYSCDFQNNGSFSLNVYSNVSNYNEGSARLRDTILGDSSEFGFVTSIADQYVWSFDHDNTQGNHWGFTNGGTINWQTVEKQGSDPGSWKATISSNTRTTLLPIRFKLAEIGIKATDTVTFTAWVKKDNATTVGAKIFVYGSDQSLAGMTYTEVTKANDTNWENLSMTFSATEAGVVEVWAEAWYISGNSNVYFGSISASQ